MQHYCGSGGREPHTYCVLEARPLARSRSPVSRPREWLKVALIECATTIIVRTLSGGALVRTNLRTNHTLQPMLTRGVKGGPSDPEAILKVDDIRLTALHEPGHAAPRP
jgi:hypothetical protein